MGNGIAQVAARAGYAVVMRDVSDEFLATRAQTQSTRVCSVTSTSNDSARKKSSQSSVAIKTTTKLEDLSEASFVIEAVTENLDVKTELFKSLDSITPPETILASNTSSISITRLGAATNRPDKVIGMHFMNPVPVMKLVEVIRGIATSDETYERVRTLSEKLGKTALDCNDSPGFVSNRVLHADD